MGEGGCAFDRSNPSQLVVTRLEKRPRAQRLLVFEKVNETIKW